MVKQVHKPTVESSKGGLREQSKRERQHRIMLAARDLFADHGYDATTLRQVAEQASLGLGTLFNYISDKRDLIYLVFNQEVSVATDVCLAAPRPWQSFNEKILSMVEPNYRLFGGEPVLSRILLSEVLQYTPGLHLAEHLGIRDRFIRGIEQVVAEAQKTGEIGSPESSEVIARHVFFSYSAALRWWLAASESPDWRTGLRDFALILKMQTAGLSLRREPNQGAKTAGKLGPASASRKTVPKPSKATRPRPQALKANRSQSLRKA